MNKVRIEDIYRVAVDYNIKVEELLAESGCFCAPVGIGGSVDSLVLPNSHRYVKNRNFPRKQSGLRVVEFGLFFFNKRVLTDKIIEEMNLKNYRPAGLHELLHFGIKHPEKQMKNPIIALNDRYCFERFFDLDVVCFPFLYECCNKRALCFAHYHTEWREYCNFLAVRV